MITEKIRHPNNEEWIDLMYVDEEEDTRSILWHGTLADNKVINARHLQEETVKPEHLTTGMVTGTDYENENLIIHIRGERGSNVG